MNLRRIEILIVSLFGCMGVGHASYYYQKDFNRTWCVQENVNDCYRGVCISGTPANCHQQCHDNALQKCHALARQIQWPGA